jgi:hypothetical protein
MGIGVVLLIWTVAGTFLAAIGGLVLRGLTQLVTRGAKKKGRAQAMSVAALFPFACLGWAGFIFLFQAFISQNLLHRDPGIGDTWHCPLPNGYALLMTDATDHGWIYNPKTQPGEAVGQRGDAVANVRTLQITGRYILGAADSRASEHVSDGSNPVDEFFLMDTQAGKHMTFVRYEALEFQAKQLGIQPNLEPINGVYTRYRFSWFDVFAGVLIFVPPLGAMYFLGKWVLKLRRGRQLIAQPA